MRFGRNAVLCGGIEKLENRRLLAATVGVADGTLSITGDGLSQTVEINEAYLEGQRQIRLSVDANGNGTFTDRGDINDRGYSDISTVVARLNGGADRVRILLADIMQSVTRTYDINTGDGSDRFEFSNPVGNDMRNSNLRLNLNTGNGNDTALLTLNRIAASTFSASLLTGNNSDNVTLYGGNDVTTSTVDVRASLGAGNDTANQNIDWEGYDLFAGSTWRFDALGGGGNDQLRTTGENGNSSGDVAGTFDTRLNGNSGDDLIEFNMGLFSLKGGTARLRGNGSIGNDILAVRGNFSAPSAGGGVIDAVLSGGDGTDSLISSANASSQNRYATSAGTVLDGGLGADKATVSGTMKVTRRSI